MLKRLAHDDILSMIDKVVHVTIFLSFIVFALETVKELSKYEFYFDLLEVVSMIIFLTEYIYRLLIAYYKKEFFKYVFSFVGIVDLLSISPLFLPYGSDIDLRFTKLLRLFSLFRIFKLYRYSEHLRTITKVISSRKQDLFATFFSIVIVLIFCSCVAYYFEKDVQPEVFSNLFQALYWGMSTLMTVGYGDIYPITIGGKITATMLSMLGIGLFTIPSAILSAGFIEEIQNKKHKKVDHHNHDHHPPRSGHQ